MPVSHLQRKRRCKCCKHVQWDFLNFQIQAQGHAKMSISFYILAFTAHAHNFCVCVWVVSVKDAILGWFNDLVTQDFRFIRI